jgi:hypothetical protein
VKSEDVTLIDDKTGTGGIVILPGNMGYASGFDEQESGLAFESAENEENKCIVFVHGIKLSVPDVKCYTASFYKRLWWEGYRGRLAVFRWSTPVDFDGENIFNRGEYRSWSDGRCLLNYVNFLTQQMSGVTISVVGHSLGNACVGSALRQGMTIDSYVMMEAAVSLSCYFPPPEVGQPDVLTSSLLDSLVNADAAHPTPDTVSDQGYRGALQSIKQGIANNWVNYFNQFDFWLATGQTSGWLLWQDIHWVRNQLELKPSDVMGPTKYEYHQDHQVSNRCVLAELLHADRPVEDTHEAMAFVARSRTRAMGAEVPGANPQAPDMTSILDLSNASTGYNFSTPRPDHSGQFQRDIQMLYSRENGTPYAKPFYRRVLEDLNVAPAVQPQ